MTSSSYEWESQPKVTDGKLYCYFRRKSGENMTEGEEGQKLPNIRWRHLWTLPKYKICWMHFILKWKQKVFNEFRFKIK